MFTAALVGGYVVAEPHIQDTEVLNLLALGVFLTSSIAYRKLRRDYRKERGRRKNRGLVLGFDVDGVLGNQIARVLPRIKEKFDVDLAYEDVTDWRLPIASSNIAVEIEDAVKDPSYVLGMPVSRGSEGTLSDLYAGHRIRVLTAREADARELTVQWLRNRGLEFDDLISTKEATKSLHGADVLIDDYLGNVEEFLANSSRKAVAILVDQPWNRDSATRASLESTGRCSTLPRTLAR